MSGAEATRGSETVVSTWNEWDPLEEIIVGRADFGCIPAREPGFEMKVTDSGHMDMLIKPGLRTKESIDAANKQLQYFVEVLEGEGVVVRRPDDFDCTLPVTTPTFSIPNMNCMACPRDTLVVFGSEVVEATMSWRCRFFEYMPYRSILRDYYVRDPHMLWTAAPKPLMQNQLYRLDYPTDNGPAHRQMLKDYIYHTTEYEPIFDAADIMRFGKDVFVHMGFTTNEFGFEWLRRHLAQRGLRAHKLHFPDDPCPFHCDATFVPLRPYLAVENPVRPMEKHERQLFMDNGWEFIMSPNPNTWEMPPLSQCSVWLCMNVLSISEKKVVVEASEKGVMQLFEQHGFDVIPVPFRDVYEFGGSFHCVTTDIRRRGELKSYFPTLDNLDKPFGEPNAAMPTWGKV